jgi:hypothetical protein
MRFRDIRKSMGPPWLVRNGEGGAVGLSLDLIKDAMAERFRLSLLARFPNFAPEDALPNIGRDRRIPRGLNEQSPRYVGRLLGWLDERKNAGAAEAMLRALSGYLGDLPRLRIVDNAGRWTTRDPDGTITRYSSTWNWDGLGSAAWARFWVIVYPNGLWIESQSWGDPATQSWGDDVQTWGLSARQQEIEGMRAIVDDWKPGGTVCKNIIVAFDPLSFDPTSPEPDGLWGNWSKNVGGVQVPSRLSNARYLDGVG